MYHYLIIDMLEYSFTIDIDFTYRDVLVFCFFGIIKKELNDYKEMHNTKTDKKNHVTGIPAGKPNVLYSASVAYGTVSTLASCRASQIKPLMMLHEHS